MTDQTQLSDHLLQINRVRTQLRGTHVDLIRMSSLRTEIIRIVSTVAEGGPAASTREARDESSHLLDRATMSVLGAWRDLDRLQHAMKLDAEEDD